MVTELKHCKFCNKQLVRRGNENKQDFDRRRYCNHACSASDQLPVRCKRIIKEVLSFGKNPAVCASLSNHSYTSHDKRINTHETLNKIWNCQICGREQPGTEPHILELIQNESFVVCDDCAKLWGDGWRDLPSIRIEIKRLITTTKTLYY